jgi:hypothetical protein
MYRLNILGNDVCDVTLSVHPHTLVPEVYFYYFHCEGERKNKPLVESGN